MGSSPTPGSRTAPAGFPDGTSPNDTRGPAERDPSLRLAGTAASRSHIAVGTQPAAASSTGSGRMTTVSATSQMSSAGMPTRWAWSRIASVLVAW